MATEFEIVARLNAALETNVSGTILVALRDIARARGMLHVAQQVGIPRSSLYNDLSSKGNPKFSTFLKITNVLGLRLEVASKED
jgi:probable addiction module antidote protein